MIDAALSESMIAFVGVAGRVDARSPEERVVERVGDPGLDRISTVRQIVDEVYAADPPLYDRETVPDVAAAVRGFLRSRYPQLSVEAVRAVANRFAYDWK